MIENTQTTEVIDTSNATAGAAAPVNVDDELSAIWDKNFVNNGAERGDDGKFVSPNADNDAQQDTPVPEAKAEGEGEAVNGETTTLPPADVPLPPTWTGKDEVWNKLSPELRSEVAKIEQELHGKLSDQGRQIGALKPISDVIANNRHHWSSRLHPDGRSVTDQEAIQFLLNANAQLEANPAQTLLKFAQQYGVQQQLAQALGAAPKTEGQQPDREQILLDKISGLERRLAQFGPEAIDQRVTSVISHTEAVNSATRAIEAFGKQNPLWNEIPEDDQTAYINMAWQKLGQSASQDAVLSKAYDMAVYADPDLRAKIAAQKAAVVTTPEPKKTTEAAKRANAVNVTSTSSGKPQKPSLDDELSAIWDQNHRKAS